MIVTFSSKESADIIMLGKHALKVLQAIGRDYESVPAQGVITAEQLPKAIEHLEHAMEEGIIDAPNDYAAEDEEVERREQTGEEPLNPLNQPVGISQRGYPLLQMMKLASAAHESVSWEQGSNIW